MKRVALLRGGPSDEYDVSMISGAAVLKALADSGYQTKDVVITKDAEWLEGGRKKDLGQVLKGVDVVFVALHGTFGEDGTLQRLLERFNIPYTGSRALSSTIAFNKELTKQTLQPHGLNMAKDYRLSRPDIVSLEDELSTMNTHLGDDIFVKPMASGSSVGARKLKSPENQQEIIQELLLEHEHLLAEEYIDGLEATVGVLENFRDESLYAFPVVEIIPPDTATFYDQTVKYNGDTKHIVPGSFTPKIKDELQRLAKLVHTELGLSQYSRSDFLIKNNKVYFLEVNTLPGFTPESNFPIAADAVGLSFKDLVSHLVETAK